MDFHLSDDAVHFNARFSGKPIDVWVPMPAVLGIYAKENGQGMMFEPSSSGPDPDPNSVTNSGAPKKPTLTVVK